MKVVAFLNTAWNSKKIIFYYLLLLSLLLLFIYIYIIIITLWEFFTSVLADGLSLEFGWPQVSSSLQDSPQYSGRSQ